MKLEARDISFRYGEGERQVLAHVDLTVESGGTGGGSWPPAALERLRF